MNWYFMAFKKYADFNGRARRKEYWMFALINTIAIYICMALDYALGLSFSDVIIYGYIYALYALATIVPNLSLSVRRLHDVGKSGWFLFISLIPLVGIIWLLVLFCTDSKEGANKYGPNPKNPSDELEEIGTAQA
ncbi:DUF805 domain-containing protein [Flavicella sediminum]|uniref:DUF805 domain-containing protein n=1 Tax=Flavicella sediminum TaxID=2585141 RepID=UPI00112342EB|nr:DUF805 domain-containing protein [Flavicella sediminum]